MACVSRPVDGVDLAVMLCTGADSIEHELLVLNQLNVFPIPDADTGTNMLHTVKRAALELESIADSERRMAGVVAASFARGAFAGARGNSGVILAEFLRGIAEGLDGEPIVTGKGLVVALESAADCAFKAVSEPVDGTMLTVIRDVAREVSGAFQAAGGMDSAQSSVREVLERAVRASMETVDRTPDLLPVLRENGVVDAGALGVAVFLQGMRRGMGDAATELWRNPYSRNPTLRESAPEPHSQFGFCTEFIISNPDVPIADMRRKFATLGDSLVVAGDAERVRVHLHTNDPGAALTQAVSLGRMHDISVRNMDDQHAEAIRESAVDSAAEGILAFAAGDGFAAILESLGVVVRTFDTSASALLADTVRKAVASCRESELIVVPCHPRIADLLPMSSVADGRTIHVVDAPNPPSGIAAVMAFQFGENPHRNVEAMSAAARAVKVIEAQTDESIVAAVAAWCRETAAEYQMATLYYGRDVTDADARLVAGRICQAEREPTCEAVYGGQTDSRYLVALE